MAPNAAEWMDGSQRRLVTLRGGWRQFRPGVEHDGPRAASAEFAFEIGLGGMPTKTWACPPTPIEPRIPRRLLNTLH